MARSVAERADAIGPIAEVFREHGYEGASLSLISRATGLGKGSLYHFFPGGKADMAAAVLAEIDDWFEREIFAPLADGPDPERAIAATLLAVKEYFRSGRRVCLVGALALGETRDRFASPVRGYFVRWIEALASALRRCGYGPDEAMAMAIDAVGGIQGAIVVARALGEPQAFGDTLDRVKKRLTTKAPAAEGPTG